MRVVVAHGPDLDDRELRRIVLGSGLDCGPNDCVRWNSLSKRLGEADADLVLVSVDDHADESWQALREARALTESPLLAIGRTDEDMVIERARGFGVASVLDRGDLRRALDTVLEQWSAQRDTKRRRGRVVSVYAPTPGSGGTTVAANLAGALARKHPDDVALIEMSAEFGDLAMLLNLTPRHSASDVCKRWRGLDPTGLKSSFCQHASGLLVLANAGENHTNPFLTDEAARRLAILSRMTAAYSVLSLDNRLTDVEVEAMQLSDAVALVVRPDVPAVRRAQWTVDQAVISGVPRDRFHLVVNRFGQSGQLALTHVEESLGMRATALIPDDPRSVNRAANMGQLLHEQSRVKRISRRFSALANKLHGVAT
ncbi:MAG: hypothetical protein R3C99_15695 [Pirellulaceae bacterium]|nr:hypothetical protein [Planctomycetales bacterium]MCA9164686.1 hypothetical protein [Planctomycetales bacterium]MCA9204299.1 hypothetical protein [Planctomycetales bacterium]MCA9210983.1 hypothetical protein [Planctomycetales bacterium]MCA9224209.1 hypothetical protein [Planctomycetales bacterium]